jgi:Domain of unknown function (DUF4268)
MVGGAGVGKIKKMLDLRTVWKNEVAFTSWLEQNIDVLADAIGLRLSDVARERNVGDFSLDLSAQEEGTGRLVVIENQIERSDHDHLGKLLTYLAGIDGASVAIWIVKEPRPEHVKALSWLNTSVEGTEFYLVKLEAIAIGESPYAPLLTQIVAPSPATRQFKAEKKDLAARFSERREFWTEFLKLAKAETNLHSAISPPTDNWISTGAGRSGLSWNYVLNEHDARVELWIDTGDASRNKAIFETLASEKADVEAKFGGPLFWDQKDERRSCKVFKALPDGGWRDIDHREAIMKSMLDAMIRFHAALSPLIPKLPA